MRRNCIFDNTTFIGSLLRQISENREKKNGSVKIIFLFFLKLEISLKGSSQYKTLAINISPIMSRYSYTVL